MTLGEIIAEIKTDFKSYHASGLLDEISMERWGLQALRMFGKGIMTLHDTIVDINNGKGELPVNFFSLYAAYECTPKTYEKKKVTPVLQSVRTWKETSEKIRRFDSCNECKTSYDEERIITEKFYVDSEEYSFTYVPKGLLRLGKTLNKSSIADECRNKFVKQGVNEIMIRGEMIYTNYPEGCVYMQYFGIEEDEEGEVIIPDSSRNAVAKYVEDYIKYKVVEKLVLNQDDTNLVNLLALLKQNMAESFALAKTDVAFDTLTPESFKRLRLSNIKDLSVYENPINKIKKW